MRVSVDHSSAFKPILKGFGLQLQLALLMVLAELVPA
jgi:hypothetical protein